MVYCGKPSKGCQACRQRKTRCDRQIPSCGQCIRTSRICPGYRSELDLMFRDESEAVTDKAKAKDRPKKSSGASMSSDSNSSYAFSDDTEGFRTTGLGSNMLVAKRASQIGNDFFYIPVLSASSIAPTLEEQGLGYFSSTSHTWLPNYDLTETICSQGDTGDHLLACMSAIGLAAFSSAGKTPQLMPRARKEYIKALRLTNLALRSPDEAKKDSTLFTVMIMSVFEMITGSGRESLKAWSEHIQGSSAIILLRGVDQFRTAAGRRLFIQVFSNVLITCIQRNTSMPEHIIRLRDHGTKYYDTSGPAWSLADVLIDVTTFRAAVWKKELVDAKSIMETGLSLDQRFLEICANTPEDWKCKTVHVSGPPDDVWNGFYNIYPDSWTAQIWNGMRTGRIVIHETIYATLTTKVHTLSSSLTADEVVNQIAASIEAMLSVQSGVFASVPQYTSAAYELEGHKSRAMRGSNAAFLLWPLYAAATVPMSSWDARLWAATQMRKIGRLQGVKQAVALAEFLESGGEVHPRSVEHAAEESDPADSEIQVRGAVEAEEIVGGEIDEIIC